MNLTVFSLYIIIYYAVHSFLTSHWIKRYTDFRGYRILYNLIAILTITPIVFSLYHHSAFSGLYSVMSILGVVLILFGVVIHKATFKWFTPQEFAGTAMKKEEEKRLISDGIYETVRHPFYLGSLFMIWGLWLLFNSSYYLVFALLSTMYVFIGSKLEEAKLIRQFGTAYREYIAEVPMLIPSKKPTQFLRGLIGTRAH